MHITYAIINYFLLFILLLTFTLPLFLISKFRLKFVAFINKYGITLDNQILYTTLYFIFTVLIAVLMDSGWAFKNLYYQTDFESYEHSLEIELQNYKQELPLQKEIYLTQFRKNRQYFIAQKNFILASFALFSWFVLCRIIMFIVEITENQVELQQKKIQRMAKNCDQKQLQKNENNITEVSNISAVRENFAGISNKEDKSRQITLNSKNMDAKQINNMKNLKLQ